MTSLVSRFWLGLLVLCHCSRTARGDCLCLGSSGLAEAMGTKYLLTMGSTECLPVKLASGMAACYPKDYGSRCKKWDVDLPATCADRDGRPIYGRPAFCEDNWCYVDTSSEGCVNFYPSYYFSGLFYSYAACGSKNTFEAYQASTTTAAQFKTVLHGYVKSAVTSAVEAMTSEMSASGCSPVTGCNCQSCKQMTGVWDVSRKVDLQNSGYFVKGAAGEREKCLASDLHSLYEHIAAKEKSTDRLGFMYFGSQGDGSMTQWPAMENCPETLDYRYRPWYSSAASGAKDVVIIVDTSGSMGGSRISLALEATKAVLDTLVDSDYAVIVRFSSDASASTTTLQPMSEDVKAQMKSWATSNIRAGGGTNFREAFTKAYEVLALSRQQGHTSNCKTMMLFLSDGDPSDWGNGDASYQWLTQKAEGVGGTMIHTYALGSGISTTGKRILKRIACEHRGIYHEASDGGDLGSIMARYYAYLAVGTDSANLQWRQYKDSFTGTDLLAACLPAFNKAVTPRQLLGVSCMDINALTTLSDLSNVAGYTDFKANYEDAQKFCAPFRLTASDAQILRKRSSSSAVCDTSDGVEAVVCGDGVVDGNPNAAYGVEECDDGNAVSGDGCSSTCKVEPGWVCPRFGYIKLGAEASEYLHHPRLFCQGENLESPVSTVGQETSWAYCRTQTTEQECRTWCSSVNDCVGFNFYANSWGLTNGCCFRKKIMANEFLDSTQCYAKTSSGTTSCMDDSTFLDENNHPCWEWAGYDCSAAVTEWGYTAQGQTNLLDKCKSSCGVCSGAVCHPRCSRNVNTPADCKDCQGDWGSWGGCAQGTVVQKPGGRVECVQQRTFQVTTPKETGWADCHFADGTKEFRMQDIFNPSQWGACTPNSGNCGAGTKTRTAPCLGGSTICSTYGADYTPVTSEPCDKPCGVNSVSRAGPSRMLPLYAAALAAISGVFMA